jgi:ABC-type transporter Mla MlaB component
MAMTGQSMHTLVLTGDAGIKSAQDVAGALLKAIDAHAIIAVDTQTVSTADITTVQTLLSARATAHARNKSLTMLAPLGGPLQAALAQAGFLSPEQEHAGFWAPIKDQPAGH